MKKKQFWATFIFVCVCGFLWLWLVALNGERRAAVHWLVAPYSSLVR